MSLPMDARCIVCHLRRNVETALSLGDMATATAFTKELLPLYLSAPADGSAPHLGPATAALLQKYYALPIDRYADEKRRSNAFVLTRLPYLRERVAAADDPLLAGLKFAIYGNYLDYAALQGRVSFDQLDSLLDTALTAPLDEAAVASLKRDLAQAKTLLYLTDNAGEIGFDRVFAEVLARCYPALSITFCVRGMPAANDATRADAEAVGIPFPVIDNGCDVAGTPLDRISPAAHAAIADADVVLAKGQGNAETMLGCGFNVYYAFLVKCERFVELSGKPLLTPVLMRDPSHA